MSEVILTHHEIRRRLELITTLQDDCEHAHIEEDLLYTDLLRAIAEGRCDLPVLCARLAMATKNLTFERWYA